MDGINNVQRSPEKMYIEHIQGNSSEKDINDQVKIKNDLEVPMHVEATETSEVDLDKRSIVEKSIIPASIINQQFEEYSEKRLESILSPIAAKATKAEEFNEESYKAALEIFYGKGKSYSIAQHFINEIPSYGVKALVRDIAYIIDNFPKDSPYLDSLFFSKMFVPPLDYRIDPALKDFKALSCYIIGRFILNINGHEPLSCPKDQQEDFFRLIYNKSNNPYVDVEIRSILRELAIQGIMHCEMPPLRRADIMRSLFREHILVPQQSDPVKQTILSTFAVIGEKYRPVFGDEALVPYARELLVSSLRGIYNSEPLMAHWNTLIKDLIKLIRSGAVNKDSREGINKCVQHLLADEEYPADVQESLHILDQLCKE